MASDGEGGDTRKIVIRGGLTSSERVANGLRFDHDSLAELAKSAVEGPFVVDHGMSLSDIAGQVTKITAERREIEVALVNPNDGKSKSRIENATFLSREATLTSENPAFVTAEQHIKATRGLGKIPHTSISLQASKLIWDTETRELRLGGPFRFIHDSLVSRGAFSPKEDGVGAMEIEMGMSAAIMGNESQEAVAMCSSTFQLTNAEELAVSFAADNPGNKEALLALRGSKLVARDSEIFQSLEEEVPNTPSASVSNQGTEMDLTETTADPLEDVQAGAENEDITPAAPSGASDDFAATKKAMESRLAALEAKGKEADDKVLSEARDNAIALGLEETMVDECTSVAEIKRLVSVFNTTKATSTRAPEAPLEAVARTEIEAGVPNSYAAAGLLPEEVA